jgi:hypothetical protein
MQQYIVPINNEALSRAIKALHGEPALQAIYQAYAAIDEAMKFGWEAGRLDEATKVLAERATETQLRQEAEPKVPSFTPEEQAKAQSYGYGYDDGYDAASATNQDSFDDGYCEGVDDARRDPEAADEYIDFLVNGDEYDSFDPSEYTDIDDGGPYNEANVSDSGTVANDFYAQHNEDVDRWEREHSDGTL